MIRKLNKACKMKIDNFISHIVNRGITSIDHNVKKIANNPSAVQKVLQLASKIFAAFDLYYIGQVQKRGITDTMKGTSQIIEFYSSYKDFTFWVNLFSKESLDKKTLKASINSSLCATLKKNDSGCKKIADKIFNKVMNKESYHSKGEVLEAIKKSLIEEGYSFKKVNQIANRVIIQQKVRPIILLLMMVCFTAADLGSNILTLKSWNMLDLSSIGAAIGSQSRVGMFVTNLNGDIVLKFISAGLVLAVIDSTSQAITQRIKYHNTTDQGEMEAAREAMNSALISLLVGGSGMVSIAAPMLFNLDARSAVALSIISKGIGLICVLVR